MSDPAKKPSRIHKLFDEFKAFIMRGNVIDLAVGVIIGGAFGKITTSLVNDLFMPLVGLILGGVKFETLEIILAPPPPGSEEPVALKIGSFIGVVLDFLLIAIVVFIFIKLIASLQGKSKPEEPETPAVPELSEDVALLTEIRDLLKKEHEDK